MSKMMRSKTSEILFAVVALAIFFFAVIGAMAQAPAPSRSLLALSKRNHTLAIVDPNTLQVIARAPVGPDPHEVIASSDGKTAYVSIYGGGRYHALSVIDLAGHKALPDIDTGALNGPHGLVHRTISSLMYSSSCGGAGVSGDGRFDSFGSPQ